MIPSTYNFDNIVSLFCIKKQLHLAFSFDDIAHHHHYYLIIIMISVTNTMTILHTAINPAFSFYSTTHVHTLLITTSF